MKIGFLFSWLLSFLMISFAYAENPDLTFKPVEVSGGDLLFFVRREDPFGRPEVLYAFDPSAHDKPQKIWQGNVPIVNPIARLSQNLVLFECINQHSVVDLKTGKVTPLLGDNQRTSFLDCRNGTVFFLKHTTLPGVIGYELGNSETDLGKTVMKDYFRPQDFLYRYEKGKAKQLVDLAIGCVLDRAGDHFWVISSGDRQHKNRKLCKIGRDGAVEEIFNIDNHWVAPEVHFQLSPNGKYVALTALHDGHGAHSERELVVVDLDQKQVVFCQERVTDLFPGFGNLSSLWTNWKSESVLTFGWSEMKQVDMKRPELIEKVHLESHSEELVFTRESIGLFDREDGFLFFKGDNDPIGKNLEIGSSGEWAAFLSEKPSAIHLVDGKEKSETRLLDGWCYNLKWLASP